MRKDLVIGIVVKKNLTTAKAVRVDGILEFRITVAFNTILALLRK